MSNRPACFTEADLRRAVKVADEFGPECVVEIFLLDATIRLTQEALTSPAPKKDIVIW